HPVTPTPPVSMRLKEASPNEHVEVIAHRPRRDSQCLRDLGSRPSAVAFDELERPTLRVAQANDRALDLQFPLKNSLLGLQGTQEKHEPRPVAGRIALHVRL